MALGELDLLYHLLLRRQLGGHLLLVSPTDSTWRRAEITAVEIADGEDGFSAVTWADGALYAIQGDPFAFVLGQDPELPFSIVRVELGRFDDD